MLRKKQTVKVGNLEKSRKANKVWNKLFPIRAGSIIEIRKDTLREILDWSKSGSRMEVTILRKGEKGEVVSIFKETLFVIFEKPNRLATLEKEDVRKVE